jgi:hypothetical protein
MGHTITIKGDNVYLNGACIGQVMRKVNYDKSWDLYKGDTQGWTFIGKCGKRIDGRSRKKIIEEYIEGNMDVYKYADISTAHITPQDNDLLGKMAYTNIIPEIVVYDYEYGYFVPVPSDNNEEQLRKVGFSEAFLSLLKRCRQEKIMLIRIDKDAPEADDLETFEW